MKCPKCDYNSFDHMPSCRKCGHVFTKAKAIEPFVPLRSSLAGESKGAVGKPEVKKVPEVKKTVAAIRDALDELKAEEPQGKMDFVENETGKWDEEVYQLKGEGASPEKVKEFPSFNEVNWEESISLSNDELFIDIDEHHKESEVDRELRFEEEDSDASRLRVKRLRDELEHADEEVRKIEEEPKKSEEHPGIHFNLSTVKKGGFWIRCAASMIDGVVIWVIDCILLLIGLVAFGLGPSGLQSLEEGMNDLRLVLSYYVCGVVINIFYYSYFHGSTGQTPGKMVCKLRVVRVTGEPLGYSKAFLRWLCYMVSAIPLFLGYVWVAWDTHKQAWHDKIAGTCVIRLR